MNLVSKNGVIQVIENGCKKIYLAFENALLLDPLVENKSNDAKCPINVLF